MRRKSPQVARDEATEEFHIQAKQRNLTMTANSIFHFLNPIFISQSLPCLPVPLMIIWAPSWSWIIAANVLLGMNQGLAWSMTDVRFCDLLSKLLQIEFDLRGCLRSPGRSRLTVRGPKS
jgi:hypothetical protein